MESQFAWLKLQTEEQAAKGVNRAKMLLGVVGRNDENDGKAPEGGRPIPSKRASSSVMGSGSAAAAALSTSAPHGDSPRDWFPRR